ncbi:GNAT family N-acetyltransferase, partial [Streptomyces sp. NPDC007000]
MSRDMSDVARDRHGRPPRGRTRGGPTSRFTAAFHSWWARRHGHAPPASDTGGGPPPAAAGAGAGGRTPARSTLWRMRTTVRDEPG